MDRELLLFSEAVQEFHEEVEAMSSLPERNDIYYQSTKTFTHSQGLSSAFRQWRAESHCHLIHGYALQIHLVFQTNELDIRNWVVDFGSLKSLKGWLEDTFDHKLLVAEDDPELETFKLLAQRGLADIRVLPAVGCEAFSRLIFEWAELWLQSNGYSPRVQLKSVEVREHSSNSAKCVRKVGVPLS